MATVFVACYKGYKPVFVDADIDTRYSISTGSMIYKRRKSESEFLY